MDLRMTVVDPSRTGACAEVSIAAGSGTPLSAVADQLAAAVASIPPGSLVFECEGRRVDPSHPLGMPPLLQGAFLTLHRPTVPGAEPAFLGEVSSTVAMVEVHVIAGPDAGGVHPLCSGRHSIGRAAANSIQVSDPDLSRTHAELRVGDGGITVSDTGSTNGTSLGTLSPFGRDQPVNLDEPINVGGSTLVIRHPRRPPAAATLDGEGHRMINRRPHLRSPRPEAHIVFPAAPAPPSRRRLPWIATLLPLFMAVPLAVVWRQSSFLLFAVMTPVMMIGQHLADRRWAGQDASREQAAYEHRRREQEMMLRAALAEDAAYVETTSPDLAHLSVTVAGPTDDLWRRTRVDADFLVLRLGRGSDASSVVVERPAPSGMGSGQRERVSHDDVPIAVDLAVVRVLGICGPRSTTLGLVRSLIGQMAVLHSPQEVRIQVLVADERERSRWRWVDRLPHGGTDPNGPGTEMSAPGGRSLRVVVLDGAQTLRRDAQVAEILRAACHAEMNPGSQYQDRPGSEPLLAPLVICLDGSEQALPLECGATITFADPQSESELVRASDVVPGREVLGSRTAVLRRSRTSSQHFAPDLAGARWAERLSRHLAPLRDATPDPQRSLPTAVRLVDLLAHVEHVQSTDPVDLARHWRQAGASALTATLGVDVTGRFRVDLRNDGPHMLIAGTTGSGKSELLRTLVAGLAVNSSPEAVSFLLVDYKGGAAFAECAALPHVSAVITDLDLHLARRALASMRAELRRRESTLSRVGCDSIDAYGMVRAMRPELPPLPRLVVIVDEFRVLAEELPEFVSGLVRTATVGRSLGVHLVLATQRPAGVVSADIAANMNLRIALRVRDSADSVDLIASPAAAQISHGLPGRAVSRSGADPLRTFQAAQVSGRLDAEPAGPVVRRVDENGGVVDGRPGELIGADTSDAFAPSHRSLSDLGQIAQAARGANNLLDLTPVLPAWLPPLPHRLAHPGISASVSADPSADTAGLVLGLADLPDEQCQTALDWLFDGSHLAIAGGPRSGRTTAIRTLARAAACLAKDQEEGEPWHVYVLDGSGSLADCSDLPQVEAVIRTDDLERADRLLRLVRSEISERQQRLAAGDRGRFTPIVLLVDGWEALTTYLAAVDHGLMLDEFMSIVRDGASAGLHVAISGGRTLLTAAISTLLTERVVLRFADPADVLLAGAPASFTKMEQTPGRGVWLSPRFEAAREIQVALPPSATVRVEVPPRPGMSSRTRWRIPTLPQRLTHQELLAASAEQTGHHRHSGGGPATPTTTPLTDAHRCSVPIGIGGDHALPVHLHLVPASVTLILGSAGAGRTSALRCIAAGLQRISIPVLLVGGSIPESTGPPWIDVTSAGADAVLARALAEQPDAVVLMDEVIAAGSMPGSAAEAQLEAVAGLLSAHVAGRSSTAAASTSTELIGTTANPSGAALVLATSTTAMLSAYRGVLLLARGCRTGLLLGGPAPGDGELLGARLPRRLAGPPGRALLVTSGRATALQLALPPAEPVRESTPEPASDPMSNPASDPMSDPVWPTTRHLDGLGSRRTTPATPQLTALEDSQPIR
jgi:S-DNA-T family DNA segregation ATPase FtsK/SpoIIIE